MADGFKGNSGGKPQDSFAKANRNGTNRPGSKVSAVPNSGDSKSPTGSKVNARRKSDEGGSSNSTFQDAIGGPFGGRSGDAASKKARVDGLPA